jgi:hypothetical protein
VLTERLRAITASSAPGCRRFAISTGLLLAT